MLVVHLICGIVNNSGDWLSFNVIMGNYKNMDNTNRTINEYETFNSFIASRCYLFNWVIYGHNRPIVWTYV